LASPPWASDAWPVRVHARHLPDPCTRLASRARQVLPGPRVDQILSGSDDTDDSFQKHTCVWNATHIVNGMREQSSGSFSVEYDLHRGTDWHSDADIAHRSLLDKTLPPTGSSVSPISGIGEEARLITERSRRSFTSVTVIARKANVVTEVEYLPEENTTEQQAAATAVQTAKTAFTLVQFS
jgi:hypothetical protein